MGTVEPFPAQYNTARTMEAVFRHNNPIKIIVGKMGGKTALLRYFIEQDFGFPTWYIGSHVDEMPGKTTGFTAFRHSTYDDRSAKRLFDQLNESKVVLLFDDALHYAITEVVAKFKKFNFRRYAIVSSPDTLDIPWIYDNTIQAASWNWNHSLDADEIVDNAIASGRAYHAYLEYGVQYDSDIKRRNRLEAKLRPLMLA